MDQQQQKGMVEEAHKTVGFVAAVTHAVPIPLRTLSRVPGSMGAGYMFPGILWAYAFLGVMSALFFPNYPPKYVWNWIQITGWAWLIHTMAYFRSYHRGKGTYSHHTGAGWLNWIFPNSKDPLSLALISDVIVAIAAAAVFFHYGDGGTARLMLVYIPMCLLSSFLLSLRDSARRRKVASAIEQQREWQSIMQQALYENDLE